MLGYSFKRLKKTTLHYPPLLTPTLHLQSKPPLLYLPLLAPFLGLWVVPFHGTVTANPGFPKLTKGTETPTIANTRPESRPQESEQDDKWSFCLTAGTLCPANQEKQ